VVRGTMEFELECSPAFPHTLRINERGACFHSPGLCLGLGTRVALERGRTAR
jgi:hypothetical protein